MKHLSKILVFLAALTLVSCGAAKLVPFEQTPLGQAPDYAQKESWAVLPRAYPPALSELVGESDAKAADVFFIYPTLFSDKKDPRYNANVFEEAIRQEVIDLSVSNQASAFAAAGKLYVPYYRQVHIRVFDTDLRPLVGNSWEVAYEDVKRAFEHYLEHYNQGRPIIIAGHSQGSMHASRLVKEFFDGTPLQAQLIAAYLPGAGIEKDYYQQLELLEKPDAVGGFVSWNTYKQGNLPKERYENYYKGRSTTNPITFNASEKTTFEQHKGLLYYDKEIYAQSIIIELIDGMVWATVPKVPKRFFMSFIKNYHAFDINLFWKDISDNAVLRTEAWLNQHQGDYGS
ncbi:MAG: DUF3089 domain-containing protein [Flavobacteriaceae bacterium]